METTFSKDRDSGIRDIAFFDLDHTIISENSGKIFIQYAYNKDLVSRIQIIWGIYLSLLHRLELKDPVLIISSITSWLKGIHISVLTDLSNDLFNNYLIKYIRPQIEDKIKFHKMHGCKIVILSSSIFPICKAVADHFKMDDVICSRLETRDEILTGKPEGQFCFGKEKVKRLREYCEINNTDLDKCWYYGDSIADLPALNLVGHPVCVAPDKKLSKVAREKGWDIIYCD